MGEGTGMDGQAAGKTQGHPGLDEGQEGWGMLERAREDAELVRGTHYLLVPNRSGKSSRRDAAPPHLNGLLIKSFIRNL